MDPSSIKYINTITVEEYNILRTSVGWNEIESNQAQVGLDNSLFIVAALYEGKTIGLARVVGDGGYIVIIVDVIVLPEYQGAGVGKSLMGLVMDYLKSSIGKGKALMVNLMAAKGRESFYSQFGFVKRPNERLGAGMTQLLEK